MENELAYTVAEDEILVTDDLDKALRGSAVTLKAPSSESEGDQAQKPISTVASLLDREPYTWTSPYNSKLVVKFKRPKGGTREMVSRILGADHSDNSVLTREYVALASIFAINGEREPQPYTTLMFKMLKQRVGWVGPGEDDWFDEPIAAFVFAYELAMYPGQLKIRAELDGAGLSPEDENRIMKNAGLERPKA